MVRALVVFCSIVLAFASWAGGKNFGNVETSEITSIYDGDTFRANIATWPAVVGERMLVRVSGIDTPELRGKCPEEKAAARKAKQFAVAMLRGGKKIELRNIERGKYFRLLADVYVDGVSLGGELVANGHAVAYDGGTKVDWCKQ